MPKEDEKIKIPFCYTRRNDTLGSLETRNDGTFAFINVDIAISNIVIGQLIGN